ncbi:MAG: PAS domain-containing protein [Bdellovibrionales bacterium]|nr:PAS domain-containing protein [Bdellovibrionales bacterium]
MDVTDQQIERQKRRRELSTVLLLAVVFLVLTAIEYKLFGMSQQLGFKTSIFFLGLVNFNIILFLLMFFLIFRNVVKIFAERQTGLAGGTLKAKLIAAFVSFSIIPTALMFLVSVFYINNSFDKWFSEKMAGVLKSSLEVTNAYYLSAKRKNYHFAERVATELKQTPSNDWGRRLVDLRKRYSLDAVEYYPSLFGQRVVSVSPDESLPEVPPLSLELLERGIEDRNEASTIHQFENGNLVRVIFPVGKTKQEGAVVVSTFIPLSLIAKMDDIASAYEDFRDVNPLEYPIKSIYLIILVLMTLTIMLGATWFGFYLARQLSVPLEELGEAAQRVAGRDYSPVVLTSGSREINELVSHFNKMAQVLETSEREVSEANTNLRQTLARLNEHSRYIEVVLSTVSTGVVSVDPEGHITMVNRHAAKLLQTRPERLVGKHIAKVLEPEYYEILENMIQQMRAHQAESIQREVRLAIRGRSIPLQMTLSFLTDENQTEIGKVVVFDDLTPVLGAQRAAAWTEVARRIAHEIKNPLTPIKLSAERLEKKFGAQIQDEAFRECIQRIIDQVDSLKNLVNEFNQFARLPKSNPVSGNLNKVISEGLVLFQNDERGSQVQFQPDEAMPNFTFDPDQMRRIINNLVDNALSAIAGRADGLIKVRSTYDGVLRIARIEIEDNGPGIPATLRERIFEPYVTTKEHGTGLGLALVKRMVEDHHGFIRAFSDGRTQTRIVIELPVVESMQTPKIVRTRDSGGDNYV